MKQGAEVTLRGRSHNPSPRSEVFTNRIHSRNQRLPRSLVSCQELSFNTGACQSEMNLAPGQPPGTDLDSSLGRHAGGAEQHALLGRQSERWTYRGAFGESRWTLRTKPARQVADMLGIHGIAFRLQNAIAPLGREALGCPGIGGFQYPGEGIPGPASGCLGLAARLSRLGRVGRRSSLPDILGRISDPLHPGISEPFESCPFPLHIRG